MTPASQAQILEKPTLLKRIGYALIVVALVFLLLISTSATLYSPLVAAYSYLLILGGITLVVLNKIRERIQLSRLLEKKVYCAQCGWTGTGADWYRYECCPECDSEEVSLL